jgi:hypothetical protein
MGGVNMLDLYCKAAHESGRSLLALLLEASRLRISPTRLGLTEYIDFRLYQPDLSWADKLTFGGIRTQRVLEDILIDDYSRFLSLDKLTMYFLMLGYGLPIPRIVATYRTTRPLSVVQLHTPDELIDYLGSEENLPIYVKRSFGSYGRGNVLLRGITNGLLQVSNGESVPVETFARSLDDGRALGWILQEPLTAHAAIRDLTASSNISGLRVHTFLADSGVALTKAIFKINVGTRDSDNFEHGASGNMLGAVDLESGRVTRVIAGVGPSQSEHAQHPVSGTKLSGFVIPHWPEVVKLVENVHAAFPGFICPGWDIALCDSGPVLLEVNAFGDIDLAQHAYRIGFLDQPFRSLMRGRKLETLMQESAADTRISPLNNRVGSRRHHWQW